MREIAGAWVRPWDHDQSERGTAMLRIIQHLFQAIFPHEGAFDFEAVPGRDALSSW